MNQRNRRSLTLKWKRGKQGWVFEADLWLLCAIFQRRFGVQRLLAPARLKPEGGGCNGCNTKMFGFYIQAQKAKNGENVRLAALSCQ